MTYIWMLIAVSGIGLWINERRRLRAALARHGEAAREAGRRLERVVAACPGMTLHDGDGRVLMANVQAAAALGIDAPSAIGRTFAELRLPAALLAAWETHRRPTADRAPRRARIVLDDGDRARILDLDVSWPEGDDATTVCLWRDASAEHADRQRLERREVLFDCLFAHAPVGIAVLGEDHRYAEVNPALCAMLGSTADELKALPYAEMSHPLDLETELGETVKLINGQIPVMRFQRRYAARDGREVWTSVTGTLCKDRSGAFAGMIRVIIDLADKQVIARHERMMAELQRSNRDLERYASIASHDLQEPVRMVSSHLTLIAERMGDRVDDKARHHLAAATDAAVRMRQLIRDLIEYARLASMDRTLVPVDLGALLAQAQTTLAQAIAASGCIIDADPLPALPVDPAQMTTVFRNLLSNAIKFRATGAPRVRVTATTCAEGWLISIADNGMGVAPAQVEEIFGIFRRLHSRERYPGTGIGLALCRKIVEGHGGRIWMESVPGEGATVRFIIPSPTGRAG